jgi:hypothetical protein
VTNPLLVTGGTGTLGRGDVAATRTLVDAARRAGSPPLIYISIVGVDRVPFFYYRAKLEAEQVIENSELTWAAGGSQRRRPGTGNPVQHKR